MTGIFPPAPRPLFPRTRRGQQAAFIHLHLATHRRAFPQRQGHYPLPQQLAQPMHRAVIQTTVLRRRKHWQIVGKISQHLPEFPFRNARAFDVFILH